MTGVWLITGSSRGLGLAITEAVLKAGGSVIATCRKPSQLDHLVKEYGSKIFPIALDVANNDEVLKVVKAGHEKFGRIDVVVNNAGYANTVAVEDITIEDFTAQMDTNFYGVVYVSKAVLPILRKQGSGHIFQISSLGGRMGTPGLAAYQSAKAAVDIFSTILSKEAGPLGVKVTVMEPGGIRTDWAGSSMAIPPISEPYKPTVGAFTEMIKQYAGQEPSLPWKIAEICLKLAGTEDPPLRLLIGPDAVEYGAAAGRELAESDKKWEELSKSSV
ncbi:3-oxoacyl-reductase [Cadophora sp. DSE1049]|nr:3-oxoacyl-reductase [Cadophora sp. DSE1049]